MGNNTINKVKGSNSFFSDISTFKKITSKRIRFNPKPFQNKNVDASKDFIIKDTKKVETDISKEIYSFLDKREMFNSGNFEKTKVSSDATLSLNNNEEKSEDKKLLSKMESQISNIGIVNGTEIRNDTDNLDLSAENLHSNILENPISDGQVTGTEYSHMQSNKATTPIAQQTILDEPLSNDINSTKSSSSSLLNISKNYGFGKTIVDEKIGFGWKGLGSRRIIYDNYLNEYFYELDEPKLTQNERKIKEKIIYLFRTRADLDVFNLDLSEKSEYLKNTLDSILKENHIKLDENLKDKLYYHVFRDFIGYGKIDILMHDEGIEDISCDGVGIPLFIFHKKYQSISSNIVFDNTDVLDSFVVKLSQMSGKQISVYEPIVDGKLADGSRLQTTLSRTITQHSTFTIRRFREDPLTPVDLILNNTMSLHMAAYFWMAIEQSSSILFCGGTATGKTTMLNALSLFLPSNYKIVSIEDTREINLPHENWIAGTTRTGFSPSEQSKTGKDIDMFDLVRVALRQRPKAIIVGEVRGKEAYTLFQAMTTGHLSYSTVHASNLHALIQRLENPPISLPRMLLTSLDLVVFLNTVTIEGDPQRRVTTVNEIIKLDPETNRLVTMTPFRWLSEADDGFEYSGGSRILNRIKMQNGWSDEKLQQELDNRMVVLEWLKRKNLRSYKDVGKIVTEYRKNPETVLKKVKEDRI
jgi:flagellar protein FlaI